LLPNLALTYFNEFINGTLKNIVFTAFTFRIFPETAWPCYIQQNSVLQARIRRLLFIQLVNSLMLWNPLVYCRIHNSRIKNRILYHFGSLRGFAEGLFNVRGLVTKSNKNKSI
jgi:hypothetical protein